MRPRLSLIIGLALFVAAPAFAQDMNQGPGGGPGGMPGGMPGGPPPGMSREGMTACRADREKFCADTPRGPETRKCMVAHKTELSADCRKMMDDMQKAAGAPPEAK